jgi:quercetin dioxygenase-like cupin family protein
MRALVFGSGIVCGACATAAVQGTAAAPASIVLPASVVVPLERAPVRTSPDGNTSLQVLARGQEAFLGRLSIGADAAIPAHRDETEEYIHVLEGSGTVTIDGRAHAVAPGSTIYMAPGVEVSFRNGPAPMTALQVFAGPEPARKYERWAAP